MACVSFSFSMLVSWERFSPDKLCFPQQGDADFFLTSTFVYPHTGGHWDLAFSSVFQGSFTQVTEISISLQYSNAATKSWLLLGDCSRPLRTWGPVGKLMNLQDWSTDMFAVTQFINISVRHIYGWRQYSQKSLKVNWGYMYIDKTILSWPWTYWLHFHL